jgi:Ca2+-binding RTX toxin-like protein
MAVTHGTSADDIFNSGSEDDTFYSNSGNDVIYFGKGSGHDTIYPYSVTAPTDNSEIARSNPLHDTLIFKSGLTLSDISYYRSSSSGLPFSSLTFEINETGETITFPNWFSTATHRVGSVEFEDGGSLDLREVHTSLASGQHSYDESGSLTLNGSDESEILTGYGDTDDTISGGAGQDSIDGGYGDDLLLGNADNDYIVGGSGDDTLIGGAGNDNLIGDHFRGEVGNDLLDGGAGNDFLNGREGNDVYLFGKGDGFDTISTTTLQSLIDEGVSRTLMFKSGVLPSDVQFLKDGSNLQFRLTETGETIEIVNWFNTSETYSGQLQNIVFEDGGFLNLAKLQAIANDQPIYASAVSESDYPTAGNDTLMGTDDVDSIFGGDGDDLLFGLGNNDILDGGSGNDTITGGLGGDVINGGDGDDLIIADEDIFSLIETPTDTTNEENVNVIDGGAGNDTIVIGDAIASPKSNNQILFGRGDGHDLVDFRETLTSTEDLDRISLIFKSGLRPEDVELDIAPSQQSFAEQEDIVFRIIDTGETLTLDADFGLFPELITINFEDGGLIDLGTLDLEQIIEQTTGNQTVNLSTLLTTLEATSIQGTQGADNLVGTAGNDLFFSGGLSQGVETILGGGGSDTLVLDSDDTHAQDNANNSAAHFRIRDFVIDDVTTNNEADVLDIGSFLLGSNLNASNIGNYLHVVSGTFGYSRSSIFVDREGQFTDQDRANLTNGGSTGGNGSDLFLEFQGHAANNNFAVLTGFADNTVEQFQALIDLGFLDLSKANSEAIARPVDDESDAIQIQGTANADNLLGSDRDDIFFSRGLSRGVESIRGNGGSDTLVITADDTVATDIANNNNAHVRIRDFIIDNVDTNNEADVLDISDLLSGFSISENDLEHHLHIVSGTFGHNRSSIFIDRDGAFTDEERAALTADASRGGQGADLFLEFQGHAGNNNLAELTGFADNTIEQLQALIDMGFLKVSNQDMPSPAGLTITAPTNPDFIINPIDLVPPTDAVPIDPPLPIEVGPMDPVPPISIDPINTEPPIEVAPIDPSHPIFVDPIDIGIPIFLDPIVPIIEFS